MSRVECESCNIKIMDRSKIVSVIRNFGNAKCEFCSEKLSIRVSANDVMMMPEPHRSDAMSVFCD